MDVVAGGALAIVASRDLSDGTKDLTLGEDSSIDSSCLLRFWWEKTQPEAVSISESVW